MTLFKLTFYNLWMFCWCFFENIIICIWNGFSFLLEYFSQHLGEYENVLAALEDLNVSILKAMDKTKKVGCLLTSFIFNKWTWSPLHSWLKLLVRKEGKLFSWTICGFVLCIYLGILAAFSVSL